MSRHYFGNQYDRPYGPTVLRNWEVPKSYKGGHLVDKLGPPRSSVKIISNDRGHLVPGVSRPKERPWIRFPTTWHLPKKIDRKTADEISGLSKIKKFLCPDDREKIIRNNAVAVRKDVGEQPKKEEPTSCPAAPVEEKENERNLPNVSNSCFPLSGAIPYVPGDFTEDHHRPNSYNDLVRKRFEDKENEENFLRGQGYPRYREDFSRISPRPAKNLSEQAEETYDQHKIMLNTSYIPLEKSKFKTRENEDSPLQDAISNFQLAKELHRQNLDHIPLPDKICHNQYQKLQMMRDKEPGLALDEEAFATGIGWKGYQGYGPTRCTKLKVFRPKSSLLQPRRPGEKANSWANFEQKWRFIKHSKVTPIDLALCWDLRPENPKDEPKPPTRIDGSNGCLAPAVFTLVHTPKENVAAKDASGDRCDGIHGCGPLFYSTNKLADDKNYFFERRSARDFSEQLNQKLDESKRANSAYELHELNKLRGNNNNLNKNDNNNNGKTAKNSEVHEEDLHLSKCNRKHPCCEKQRKKSLPTLKAKHSGFCMTCRMNNISIQEPKRREEPKSDFKAAFKAGLPQKRVSRNLLRDRYLFRVPRQKEPYAFRSYRIDSLAPPFSLQKERRQDYPEHWRLATVYQHSYKPIGTRKGTLLSTVYK